VLKCTSQVEEHNGQKTVVSLIWKEDVAAKEIWRMYAMKLRSFREFGIREFVMRELFTYGIPDIPMCDELLLLWVSPPNYSMAHTTSSLWLELNLYWGFGAFDVSTHKSLRFTTVHHLYSTIVLIPIRKSRIGISGFLLLCAWDFQFPDPRLREISRHVSLLTDGSDLLGTSVGPSGFSRHFVSRGITELPFEC
jgi:hypothetical protein